MPHAKDLLLTAKPPAFTGGFAQKGILKGAEEVLRFAQ
jgi:hypothetical protein